MKANIKSILLLLAVFAVIIASVSIFTNAFATDKQFGYSDLIQRLENDLVTSFDVDGKLQIKVETYKCKVDEKTGKILFKTVAVVLKKDGIEFRDGDTKLTVDNQTQQEQTTEKETEPANK